MTDDWRGLPRRQWMPRDEATELVVRLESAGVPVLGWWHMEQGGPFQTVQRPPAGMEGEHAIPLVSAADLIENPGIGVKTHDVVSAVAPSISRIRAEIDRLEAELEGVLKRGERR